MASGAIRVKGLREFQRACSASDKALKKNVRDNLRKAGDIVKDEARSRFSRYDARSAAGYRTAVRTRGVAVQQRLGRTTGKRPDYGSLQLRVALQPALETKRSAVEQEFEQMLDRIVDGF